MSEKIIYPIGAFSGEVRGLSVPKGDVLEVIDRGIEGIFVIVKTGGNLYEVQAGNLPIADTSVSNFSQVEDDLVMTFTEVDNADGYVVYLYEDEALTTLFAKGQGDSSPAYVRGVNAPDLWANIRVIIGTVERLAGPTTNYVAPTATITDITEDGDELVVTFSEV